MKTSKLQTAHIMIRLSAFFALCLFGATLGDVIVSPVHSRLGHRIVHGSTAHNGQFPYQVSLRMSNSHFCGASIINERWILTAAHCLIGKWDNDITAFVGTNSLASGGKSYKSVKVIHHEGFSYRDVSNDVGLIKVDRNIEFSELVSPVALPSYNFNKADYPAVVSGWGRLAINGIIPTYLQYLSTRIMDHESCKNFNSFFITDKNICTITSYGEGNCNGDSGGPLVVDGTQVGIVSFVIPNCAQGNPDIYTRVWSHVDWIHTQINKY